MVVLEFSRTLGGEGDRRREDGKRVSVFDYLTPTTSADHVLQLGINSIFEFGGTSGVNR